MEKDRNPEISVIMGVYNQWDRDALRSAVESVLNQTFRNFEFIIYDDGSDAEAAGYIKELEKLDRRIILIGREENHGLAFSLNACISRSRGHYIARMDADDISLRDRLMVQYEFLEAHPEYAWCGCNAELFDEEGVWGERCMPEIPGDKDYLPFSPFIHPTVMYRRSLFETNGGYRVSPETFRCEDYEIFMRLHQAGCTGYNIPCFLFQYRENQDSFRKRKLEYRINEMKIRYQNFKKMHLLFPMGWLYVIRPLVGGVLPVSLVAWMKRKESGYKYGRKSKTEGETAILSADFAAKSGILSDGFKV